MSTEPQIKYESPYSSEPPPYIPQDPNALKRRYSETVNNGLDSGDKRQRMDSEQQPEHPAYHDDLDFGAMIAAATAAATQDAPAQVQDYQQHNHDQGQYGAPMQNHQGHQQQPDYNHQLQQQPQPQPHPTTIGFSSDPHLYMRICSLPILESLVCYISPTMEDPQLTILSTVHTNTSHPRPRPILRNHQDRHTARMRAWTSIPDSQVAV